jgi:aspartate racemase
MRRLGIVGGLGPQSTIDYYRRLTRALDVGSRNGPAPPILITSADLGLVMRLTGSGNLKALTEYLASEVARLVAAGADIGLIAANTPHIVFDEVQDQSTIPLLSIVTATRDFARAQGLKRLGLLGTRFTMQAGFYGSAFREHGLGIFLPNAEEIDAVHDIYVHELVRGSFAARSREQILRVIGSMIVRDKLDGVVLAGTELPLLVRDQEYRRVPLLDTTAIHVQVAIEAMTASQETAT